MNISPFPHPTAEQVFSRCGTNRASGNWSEAGGGDGGSIHRFASLMPPLPMARSVRQRGEEDTSQGARRGRGGAVLSGDKPYPRGGLWNGWWVGVGVMVCPHNVLGERDNDQRQREWASELLLRGSNRGRCGYSTSTAFVVVARRRLPFQIDDAGAK